MIRQIIGEVSVPVANTEVQQVIENPGIVKTYLEKYMPSLISFLVQLVVAIVILLIGIKVIKSVVKIIKKGFDKSRMDAAVASFLANVIKYFLYFILVMALLSGLAIWLGSNLKLENVSKRQAAAEFIVTRLEQFVHDNMGFHFDQYIPLIGAIFALSIGCNLISVVGLWSPTADLNTEAAWAIVVFVLIMYYKIKTNGILSYLKGLLDPIFIMAPINVLSEVSTPVSMAFRHFGNILSGTVISTLLYWALASLSHVIFGWLPGALSQIQLFQIGIPAFTGLYFDWFGGCIQAFIFCTLTAIFIKRAAGED
mgnify:CR=1 FL=1